MKTDRDCVAEMAVHDPEDPPSGPLTATEVLAIGIGGLIVIALGCGLASLAFVP
jgi:hypothetical protein